MFSSLPDLQKERGFPHPSRKKKLLQSKRESTCFDVTFAQPLEERWHNFTDLELLRL